ncbi:MAG: SDR family oxidoreductase [Azonexus sp.]|jgi:NAD(P)-dependent dehydrogenase (short-subunit alcohol dehydrogenase family)|nr:SDR family oxidoreductase [Azonexus sp.]
MGRVANKVAVITGGGSGVGRECMRLFAKEGAKVFAIGRTQAKLDAVVREVTAAGGVAAAAIADLSKPAEVERAFAAIMDTFGRVDVLVNNAGVGYALGVSEPGTMNETTTTSPDQWRKVLEINLDSTFLTCRLAIPVMRKQGGGSIVNVASIYGMRGVPDAHAYTASKGAIINYTRSLAVTYAKENIRVNTVSPGFVDTEMVAAVINWFDDPTLAERISPMCRPGKPGEIANACLFFASDESSYCTGSMLAVDGGSTAR